LNAGIEYEYLVQGFGANRIRFAPYAMVNYTTSYLSDFGSSVSPIIVRAGLAVKFGPDRKVFDTIPYNPNQFREDLLATFDENLKINFDGFLERELLVAAELAFIDLGQVAEQISEEPQLPQSGNLVDNQIEAAVEEEKPKRTFKRGDKFVLPYKDNERLPGKGEIREVLTEIAEAMRANPNMEI
jgi:hypothetical protein